MFVTSQHWFNRPTRQFRITKPIQVKLIEGETEISPRPSITQKDLVLNFPYTKQDDPILHCVDG